MGEYADGKRIAGAKKSSEPAPSERSGRTTKSDPLMFPAERELMFPTTVVGGAVTRTIALVNNDDRPLVVDAISPARSDPFDDFTVAQPRSVKVEAGQQTAIEIRFAPSRLGTARQTFKIETSNGPVGPEGDFDVVGGATEWRNEPTHERVQRQDQLVSALESRRAADALHAERVLARRSVESWAKSATELNQLAADWSRDNWLEFLSYTGGAYTLYPSHGALKLVKTVVGDWLDVTLEVEAPEGKLLSGVGAKLGAKHIQDAMLDFLFDKLSGDERPPADAQAATAADSIGKAALGKSREVDAYRDRANIAIDDARSAAEIKIQSAHTAAELEAWRVWTARQNPPKPKMADRSLRDQLLKEWLLQRAATPDAANRETNPLAWETVKKRMKDGRITTLDRQDLFLYQCQYEWQRLGLAGVDDAVARLDARRQRINDDARSWGNDEKAASRMVAAFLGAQDQTPSTFQKTRNAEQTFRALGEGISGYVVAATESLDNGFILSCNVALEASGEAVFVKHFRYSIVVAGVQQPDIVHYPRGGRS